MYPAAPGSTKKPNQVPPPTASPSVSVALKPPARIYKIVSSPRVAPGFQGGRPEGARLPPPPPHHRHTTHAAHVLPVAAGVRPPALDVRHAPALHLELPAQPDPQLLLVRLEVCIVHHSPVPVQLLRHLLPQTLLHLLVFDPDFRHHIHDLLG